MIEYRTHHSPHPGFPTCWDITNGKNSNIDEICDWAHRSKNEINTIVTQNGGLLIRNFQQLQSAKDFEEVITAIFPKLMDYVGGTSPRKKVKGKIMEATYVPPTWSIPLHQEMAYTKTPPDKIAFFCEVPAKKGGESTLGDMRKVTDLLDPKLLAKCQRHGLVLRRTLPSPATQALKPGVKKTWQEVFDTSDPKKAEEIATSKDWRIDWLQDDTMHLWQDLLPATRQHPVTGCEVWFNQAHFFSPICMMDWAKRDGREEDYQQLAKAKANHLEMLDMTFYGNGDAVSDDESRHIASVIESLETPVKLEKSDLLILDNTLIAHGRFAFQGQRQILVSLINTPEMHAKAEAISSKTSTVV